MECPVDLSWELLWGGRGPRERSLSQVFAELPRAPSQCAGSLTIIEAYPTISRSSQTSSIGMNRCSTVSLGKRLTTKSNLVIFRFYLYMRISFNLLYNFTIVKFLKFIQYETSSYHPINAPLWIKHVRKG